MHPFLIAWLGMVDFTDSASFTRYLAAGSPYTPAILLRHFADDRDPQIRRRLAENPAVPEDVVDLLIRDPDPEVRIALTENPLIAEQFIEMLVNDASPDVRFAMAENSSTSSEVLLRLAADDNPYVASRARKTYLTAYPHAAHELNQRFMVQHQEVREAS